MSETVIIHSRAFDEQMRLRLKDECAKAMAIWRDFEKVDIIRREIEMGRLAVKRLISYEPILEHVQFKVDPFTYTIIFYLVIGEWSDE